MVQPLAQELDIRFRVIEEPDEVPESFPTVESLVIFKFKLGNLDPSENDADGRQFLGQIIQSKGVGRPSRETHKIASYKLVTDRFLC